MGKLFTKSLMIVVLGLVVLWAGCGGSGKDVGPAETTAVGQDTGGGGSEEQAGIAVPAWFIDAPEDPNYLYATATGKSRDLQLAIDNAKAAGRLDIAGQMGTKVSGLFKRFREEIGAEEDAELLAMTTAVSKEVVSEVIQGCRTAKQAIQKEGISYRAYVLMEMPIGEANAALMSKIKESKNMYTRFRASQGFKELEDEVEKYEEWKKGQGM